MKTLLIMLIALFTAQSEKTLFDFNSAESSGKWFSVNDDVMGGISKSNLVWNQKGTATFSGKVSLENNGGFSSIRAGIKSPENEQFSGVMIRVRGDGNKYNLRFRTTNNFDGYAYQAKFQTKNQQWSEFRIPFSNFAPTYRGYTLSNKPALLSKNIAQIGILIADKQAGAFQLEIDWIKFYE